MTTRRVVGAIAALVLAAPGVSAQELDVARLRERIHRFMADTRLPGMAIAVAHRGEPIWVVAFGLRNRERGEPATVDTRFAIASTTKPMTATAIMRLVEDGVIDLDAPVNDYLGPSGVRSIGAGEAREATIRQVLSHTSGLASYDRVYWDHTDYRAPARTVGIDRYAILVSSPGTAHKYSNMGYGLLDLVIERVAGESYGDYLRRAVFEPRATPRSAPAIPRPTSPPTTTGAGMRSYGRESPTPPTTPAPRPSTPAHRTSCALRSSTWDARSATRHGYSRRARSRSCTDPTPHQGRRARTASAGTSGEGWTGDSGGRMTDG